MNYTNTFIKEFYHFNKREFWLIIVANVALGLIINFFKIHEFIQAGIVMIMALKSFSFLRGASVMPSISSDFDRYSWKYFQGLPLSKRELIVSLVISNLIAELPLISWLMAFYPQVAGIFMEDNAKVDISIAGKIFLALFPSLLVISINALSNQILFPRKQYSKIEARVKYLNFIKNALVGLAALVYFLVFCDWIQEYLNFSFAPFLMLLLKSGWSFLTSWFLSPLLFLFAYLSYKNVIKDWQDEKKAYSNVTWVNKRDIPITSFAFLLLAVPVLTSDFNLPERYSGSDTHAAVYHHDFVKLVEVTKEPAKVNVKNKYGYTPLMVAARRGNFAFYEYLKKKGATNDGLVNVNGKTKESYNIFYLAIKGGNKEIVKDLLNQGFSVNDKFDNAIYSSPLHLASEMCNPEIVDLLIEKKAILNAINSHGQTALHLTTQKKCFGVVTSLIEGGIDPLLKDKKGQTALAYAKEITNSKDMAYYLEKKSRAPASQK